MENPTIADLAAELMKDWHFCNKRLFPFINRNLNILGYKAEVHEINEADVTFTVVVA